MPTLQHPIKLRPLTSWTPQLMKCRLYKNYTKGKMSRMNNTCNPLIFLEAAPGLEPGNNGFADRCLSHLAMPP